MISINIKAIIPRKCPCCGDWGSFATIITRRMSTQYVHEPSNFLLSCKRCWEDAEEHWRERWEEYYSGLL